MRLSTSSVFSASNGSIFCGEMDCERVRKYCVYCEVIDGEEDGEMDL